MFLKSQLELQFVTLGKEYGIRLDLIKHVQTASMPLHSLDSNVT